MVWVQTAAGELGIISEIANLGVGAVFAVVTLVLTYRYIKIVNDEKLALVERVEKLKSQLELERTKQAAELHKLRNEQQRTLAQMKAESLQQRSDFQLTSVQESRELFNAMRQIGEKQTEAIASLKTAVVSTNQVLGAVEKKLDDRMDDRLSQLERLLQEKRTS